MASTASVVRLAVSVAADLEALCRPLDSADGELTLDFTDVGKLDPATVRALQKVATASRQKNVRVICRGASVSVYKVLKLVRLAEHFTFA